MATTCVGGVVDAATRVAGGKHPQFLRKEPMLTPAMVVDNPASYPRHGLARVRVSCTMRVCACVVTTIEQPLHHAAVQRREPYV
jgi:hypothetical protein